MKLWMMYLIYKRIGVILNILDIRNRHGLESLHMTEMSVVIFITGAHLRNFCALFPGLKTCQLFPCDAGFLKDSLQLAGV